MTIYEEFVFWILQILEDDPIPYEVKNLYFVINFKNSVCALSFVGTEIFESPLKNYEFYPLEAYWFRNQSFNQIKEIYTAKVTVKDLLEKALDENPYFYQPFKNKTLHICEYGEQINWSREV